MPLAHIDRPGSPGRVRSAPRFSQPRLISLWATIALTILVLSGCATGSAQEARRAEQRELTEEALLPERQATYSAQFVLEPTATATPKVPPAPRVAALAITTQANGDGSPNGEYQSLPSNAGTVYLCALLTKVYDGQVAAVAVRGPDHNGLAYGETTIAGAADQAWVAIPFELNGSISPGDYSASIIVGEEWISSVVFTIGGAGSSAQRVGDGGPRQPREVTGGRDPLHPGSSESGSRQGSTSDTDTDTDTDTEDSPLIVPVEDQDDG